MAYMYSKRVMELFRHPEGCRKMENPDATGQAGSMLCGDIMKVYLRIGRKKQGLFIKDISFQSFGCVANISSSSQTIKMAKGRTLEDAIKIKDMDVVRKLGGLPSIKIHCSVLAVDALREAIYNYLKKKGMPIPKEVLESHKRVQKELREVEHMREKVLK
jgi:nitrogen fixation NifU-like protein